MNMQITRERRAEIERQIDDLIEMLDLVDGDPDIEETGDEHDTGMPEGWRGSTIASWLPVLEDDEDGNDAEEDNADTEPALGWTNHIDQSATITTFATSYEDEPELGWCGNATGWRKGEQFDEGDGDCDLEEQHDREEDHAECGIADADALHALEAFGPAHSSPIKRSLGYDPALLPSTFVAQCEGNCMSPLYHDGTKLKFDRTKPVAYGDVVMIVRRPGSYAVGDHQMLVKMLVSDTRGVQVDGMQGGITAKMLNPPALLFFPESDVLDVIKCVGVADPEEVGPKISPGQVLARKAQEMAAPAFGPEPGSFFLRTERHG